MATQPDVIHTISSLTEEFVAAGLQQGMTVLVHSSMKQIGGWVVGGAEAVLYALLDAIGDDGTLMMPTHTTDNTDPSRWQNPPIPEAWWQITRDNMPPYHPATSITRQMGILPEQFRRWDGVLRSNHPIGSFAAKGKYAKALTSNHDLAEMFGDGSPISALYDLDGYVMLLGVPYDNCTSLHLAEYRADFLGKEMISEGCAMLVDGERQWVRFEMLALETDDFDHIGALYEQANPDAVRYGTVGKATTRLFKVRPLVDFAVDWMTKHRDLRNG